MLAPNRDAYVTLSRNGEFFEAYTITYMDAKNGTVPDVAMPEVESVPPIDEGSEVVPVPGDTSDPNNTGDENEDDTTALLPASNKNNKSKKNK
ncbi:hypothetical protein D3C76_1270890 [compost metagenome]